MVYYSQKYADKQRYERELAILKAKDLIENPGKYTQATSYGCTKYINNISFNKKTGEVADDSNLSLNLDKIKTEEKFDAAALVDDLIEASKKDPNSLNDSDVVRFYNSYARLINLFTKGEKITKSYSIGMSTYFKVGEESDLVVKDQEGKEVTNSVRVNGFDTSKVGYNRLELTFPDGSYYYKSYYVTNSGNYVAVSDFEATSLTSTSDINVVLYNDEKPNGEVKKLSEFENSGLDTRKAGRNYGKKLWLLSFRF